jgi:ABC-type transport system substrate-binding protein
MKPRRDRGQFAMRKIKWLFFGYMALMVLIIAGIAVSFTITSQPDPNTGFGVYYANLKTLDPAEIDDTESDAIAGCIFEGLYTYEYGKQPYTLLPELADGMPQTSSDGLTVTVHLKPGIHFYDPKKEVWPDGKGPEVKAADVVYSWKRVCNFGLGVTANYAAIFQGKVAGIDDWYDYTQKCAEADPPQPVDWEKPVVGLSTPDDRTLVIKLIQPYPQLRYNMAHLAMFIVSRDVVNHYGDKFRRNPVGSGPYFLNDNEENVRIILEANPVYRGGPDVQSGQVIPDDQRLPYVKRREYTFFQEALPPWYLFLQGKLDTAAIPKETYQQAITSAGDLTSQMRQDGIQLIKGPEAATFYTAFNMQDPIVGKNKALRQAMSMAFNRDKYIHVYLNDRGIPAQGPIPPGFATYDANYVNPYSQFNLEAARAKLKEAEQFNGGPIPELTFTTGDTSTSAVDDAEYFATQMKQIGLKIHLDYYSWARFQEMVDHKQLQMFGFGWVADYPDEQTFWQLFYSKNAGVGGMNGTNYSNPEFDKLYEQSMVMDPSPQRDAIYKKMQAIVVEDATWLFEFHPLDYTLLHDWVKNVAIMDYGEGMRAYGQIDFSARAQWLKHH